MAGFLHVPGHAPESASIMHERHERAPYSRDACDAGRARLVGVAEVSADVASVRLDSDLPMYSGRSSGGSPSWSSRQTSESAWIAYNPGCGGADGIPNSTGNALAAVRATAACSTHSEITASSGAASRTGTPAAQAHSKTTLRSNLAGGETVVPS